MLSPIFQKTARGRAEIEQRSDRIPAAMRAVLIMVNGSDSLAMMAARGVPQLRDHLQSLLTLGLIEPVPVPSEQPVSLDLLAALCRQAHTRLTPHFGPDTASVVQPLRDARTAAAFNEALDDIQARLATYLGRKLAAIALQGLRPRP